MLCVVPLKANIKLPSANEGTHRSSSTMLDSMNERLYHRMLAEFHMCVCMVLCSDFPSNEAGVTSTLAGHSSLERMNLSLAYVALEFTHSQLHYNITVVER